MFTSKNIGLPFPHPSAIALLWACVNPSIYERGLINKEFEICIKQDV